ncbi:hypothetical protein MNB_SV-15-448 [hydrothermal vent metagenome]|uniref:Uncharacterized protein n=1 Tax=hydrothermal vent metagenome TaxID=652676 RepID=A0A1W1EIW2_9ZZZZ
MFVLGVSLRDKDDQNAVYPRIGPIFGYFEIVALLILVSTGTYMIIENGLISILFDNSVDTKVIESLRKKLMLVATIIVVTIVHTYIAFKTNNIERTPLQHMISRGSSMAIFIINLFVMHYAIVIRDIL